MRRVVLGALTLLLAVPAAWAQDKDKERAKAKPPARPNLVGQMAREIEGTDLDGVRFKLSDYRGKVVVLDFWGNW
jgi:cytochrome oxidase Cu insertion factor (SCO1/SenC/PrrC family)